MNLRSHSLYKALSIVALCIVCAPDVGLAQSQKRVVEISPGRAKAFRVAVQRFRDRAQPMRPARADDLRAVIGDALDFTGILLPLDPAAYLGPDESEPLSNRGRSDCPDWSQSGADALVEGEIRSGTGTLEIEFTVWDTARCVRLARKTVTRVSSEAIRLARTVADEIVAAFTGTPGCAATEIAFVSNRTGVREIYVMDVDGRYTRTATRSDAVKSFPAWLPDAVGILYTSYTRSGLTNLYVTDISLNRTAKSMMAKVKFTVG